MPDAMTIDIDFDIYKMIEAERRNFDEPRVTALRRLLKLPPKAPTPKAAKSDGRAWSGEGVTLVHGTMLRMSYNSRQYEGQIDDGKWLVEGKIFNSPSGAASGTAITKRGKKTRLDGWLYWEAQSPGDKAWRRIGPMRPSLKSNLSIEDLGL